MLIIRPFGMSADIATRIVQGMDNDEDTAFASPHYS